MADEAKDNVHLTTWVSARQLGADHDVPDVPLRISPQTQHIPKVLGRYRLSRLLGTGGMGLVYEATTDHMPGTLAVKTLTNLSPEGLLCFKQEFRRTAALSHPHLVSLYELGHDAGLWFFSMELIRGRHLLEHVWNSPVFPGSALAVEGLRHPLPQLLDALEYLHSNGVLHLDVKPANVLVTDDGSVKLLDFGLSASEASADSNRFAGTPGYMAPEQMWGRVSAACDCYALGAMLFEAVTGQLPLTGPLASALMTKRLQPAPRVEDVDPSIPTNIARLIDGLLQRAPEERWGVKDVRRELGLAAAARSSLARMSKPGRELYGRDGERATLLSLLDDAGSTTVICRLLGDSGLGKTSLLTACTQQWQQRGALVLSSRCFEWQAIPFKAADSLVDQLYDYLSTSRKTLNLPNDLLFACKMFPVLEGLPFDVIVPSLQDPQLERTRAARALGEVLRSIASERPVVVCIDDTHWGDIESADILGHMVDMVPQGLVLVLSARKGEVRDSLIFDRITGIAKTHRLVQLELGPLSVDDSLRLIRSTAGGQPWSEQQLRALVEDASGIPFLIEQVSRNQNDRTAQVGTLEQLFREQYLALEATARTVLDVVAIARHPTPLRDILASTASTGQVHQALSQLQSQALVRCEGFDDSALLEPYHDRVRQAVLAQIPASVQLQLHRRVAVQLESTGASAGRLAEHWYLAGDLTRAAACALEAAHAAYEALAFERACELYARAFEWEPQLTELDPTLLEKQAWSEYQAGHCRQAGLLFSAAAERCSHEERRLDLLGHAIEALLVSGALDLGNEVLNRLLNEMGVSGVLRPPWRVAQLVGLTRVLRWRTRKFPTAQRADALALRRAEVMWNAGKAMTNMLPIDGMVLLLRSLLFALDSGDERAIARGLSIAASGYVPFLEKDSERLLREADVLAHKQADPYLLGMLGVTRSTAAHMAGEWPRILEETDTAQVNLEKANVPTNWERSLLAGHHTVALQHLGDMRVLAEYARRSASAAKRRGDLVAYVSTLNAYGFSQAAQNNLAELTQAIAEMSEVIGSWTSGYGLWHCALWRLQVLLALRHEDYVAAHVLLQRDWGKIRDSLLLRTRALRCVILDVRAAVLLNLPTTSRPRRQRIAAALVGDFERTQRKDAAPSAHVMRAAVHSLAANQDQALHHLRTAERQFADASMRERQAMTAWQRSRLEGDDVQRARHEEVLRGLGIADIDNWARYRTPACAKA